MYEIQRIYPSPAPTRRFRPQPTNLQGLGITVNAGIDVNSLAGSLAQFLIDALWPPVEDKINQTVPIVANMAIDIAKARMPELIDTMKPKIPELVDIAKAKVPSLVDAAKPKIPELMNIALPIAEKRLNTIASAYEKKYTGAFLTVTKYAKPMAVGAAVVGVLVVAASIKTLIK